MVIYWGTKDWDGPKSLYEMMDIKSDMKDIIQKYVNDYKLHIIVPNEIENFEQFSTELGFCLRYIRFSTNKTKLKELLKEFAEVYSSFDKESGDLIQVVTNTKLPKEAKKEEAVDMCKAIDDMMEDARMEEAENNTRRFFQNGANLELVKKSITILSEEKINSIYEEVCGKH